MPRLPSLSAWLRYIRLYWMCVRFCLIREMTFRTKFLTRCVVHIVWLGLVLVFFELIFGLTDRIGDWGRHEFLFFLGTTYTLNAAASGLFIGNLSNFADLVRTGDLDFVLVQPIDEQFLVSWQRIDWAVLPQIVMGIVLLLHGAIGLETTIDPARAVAFCGLWTAGLLILYSLLLALGATSVWIVRTGSLFESWFAVWQLARYPAEIYQAPTNVKLPCRPATKCYFF